MTSWNIKELRQLVRDKHGEGQLERLKRPLDSVESKIRIAAYHAFICGQAFSGLIDASQDESLQAIRMILSNGEERSKFGEARLVAEASAIACAQSAHSIADIFSYAIAYSLKMEPEDAQEMNLSGFGKKLPFGPLRKRITRLTGMMEFRYLQDFTNETKHVSLVPSQYNVDLEAKAHGFKFSEFTHKTRIHPAKWSVDFMKELHQILVAYVEIGVELNCAVRGSA